METAMEQKPALNHDEIAKVGRDLWQKEGCQNGRDLEYWLQAEQQLLAANGKPGTGSRNSRVRLRTSPKNA